MTFSFEWIGAFMPAILYTSDSWHRHPGCFINEDACTTEGGVEKPAHTACGTRSLSALKCMMQGS